MWYMREVGCVWSLSSRIVYRWSLYLLLGPVEAGCIYPLIYLSHTCLQSIH